MDRYRGIFFRRLMAALGAALVLSTGALQAQVVAETHPDDEPVPSLNTKPKGFTLFGIGDFAITGMRQGGNSYWKTTASGPSDDDLTFSAGLNGRVTSRGSIGGWFELQLWMAASKGDWSRFRELVPSLENVKGGGWNARMQYSRWTSSRTRLAFTGRDGSVGSLFSGVTTESGTGTCRDNSARANAFISAGYPLLAGSDCPDTWVGSTFDGERPVPDSVWLNTFKANPSGFTWDDWKIAPSRRAQDKLYGAFQTFGSTVDYGREKRAVVGSVIPGQSGTPTVEGYPLGMEWRFEAWSYAVPTVADAMFYKANIINRSADVYGVGLDYDSLFLGFMNRSFPAGTQAPTLYPDLQRSVIIASLANQNGTNCYGANHGANVTGGYRPLNGPRPCLSNTASRGSSGTYQAMVMFKSPIGDLRNKKFTDPASPFYNPTHPQRGDTLLFNVISACGFSCVTSNGMGVSARGTYGLVTGNEADVFAATRPPSEWTDLAYFDMFHNYDFPARWSPSTGRTGGFARYMPPGNWDYNHDGKLDTLKVMTCTDPVAALSLDGCVATYADTLLGGFPNVTHNNYNAGVGPIRLKAGDTTSFWVAYLSTTDSTALEALIGNVTQLYQNFWLSPEPPCPVNIVSAVPTGGNRQFDTFLRLYFDQQHNECQDKFLIEQAKVLKASRLSADVRLKVYNPHIVNNVRKIALPVGTILRDTVAVDTLPATLNACSSAATYSAALCRIMVDTAVGVIDSMLVFKSCDGGGTYTNSTGVACYPTISRDAGGGPSRYPWMRYSTLVRGSNGLWPSVYTDGSITGGVTYTYVITGQSFPASWDVVTLDASGRFVPSRYTIRPATLNGLSSNTANRNVSSVYIPTSRQAGGEESSITFKPVANDTIASYLITTRLGKAVRGKDPLTGRMVLSDSAEVEAFYQNATAATPTTTKVRLFQLGDSGTVGATRRFPVRKEEYTVTGGVEIAGHPTVTTVTSGAAKTVFSRFRTPATRRLQFTFLQAGVPMYVTDTVSASDDITPPNTLANPNYVGLFFSLDTTRQRALRGTFWSAEGLPVQLSGTAPTIGWVPGAAATIRDTVAYSRYQVTFSGKEFGPGYPFKFDRANLSGLASAYAASLSARTNAGTTDISTAAAAAIALALNRPAIKTDSLASIGVPFTVKNAYLNKSVSVAVLKSERPTTALLGTNADTLRVPVPAGQWIPGDKLYFIETFKTVRLDTVTASPLVRRIRLVNGLPDSVDVQRVTWGPTQLACATPATCNPIEGIGGTGYTATNANQRLDVLYYRPIRGMPAFDYTITPEVAGENIAAVTEGDLSLVKAVPNPYIMFSHYEQTPGVKRLMFTHLPPTGTMRIYTASGQLVQQIKWTASDLQRNCRATVNTTNCTDAGDLTWNMRTREDLEVGPGFYVFLVSTEVGGKKVEKLGKFVIIR
ncbi:MAG: hypothetical protein AABZ29_05845 [Gemmatimonadota bacterium]